MSPGLSAGDRLLVVRWLRPRVGDVVAARDPRQPGRLIVKRVSSVDGDGSVVLLGDDPAASTDSRTFGAVPRRLVVGRAVYRYAPVNRAGPLRRPDAAGRRG